MTDAAHNQHSETRRPSDRDRLVTTGPSRFQPARPEVLRRDDVGVGAGIPKNRCRTTLAERMMETLAELPLTGDQVGLFKAQPGRPKLPWYSSTSSAPADQHIAASARLHNPVTAIPARHGDAVRAPAGAARLGR